MHGCLHSHVSLQHRFFNRKQLEGESLLDYSHALMDLTEQIIKTGEQASAKSQKDLRDQFCDGVRDHYLHVRLQDQLLLNPPWSIRDARKEAVQRMTQCESQSFKQKYSQPRPVSSEVQAQVSGETTATNQSEYAKLRSLIKAHQSQLELVMKSLGPPKVDSNSNPPSAFKLNATLPVSSLSATQWV